MSIWAHLRDIYWLQKDKQEVKAALRTAAHCRLSVPFLHNTVNSLLNESWFNIKSRFKEQTLVTKMEFHIKKSRFSVKSQFMESKCADGGHSLNRDFTLVTCVWLLFYFLFQNEQQLPLPPMSMPNGMIPPPAPQAMNGHLPPMNGGEMCPPPPPPPNPRSAPSTPRNPLPIMTTTPLPPMQPANQNPPMQVSWIT